MDPFDVATLFAYRAAIGDLDGRGPPSLTVLGPTPSCRSVALLPGSFNPPTAAHLMLAERALRDGFGCVVFVLAVRTAGKGPSGLLPEDRLVALEGLSDDAIRVAVSSHPLYAEQAEAAATAFGGADVAFLVGSDKVLQIFDPAWYADREGALDRLFSRARLLVAPRSDHGDALRRCLADPANARWADRVTVMRLHPAVGDLSSTHVRGMLRAGADPGGLVPPAVASFLSQVRAFAPRVVVGAEELDPYDARARLLERLWALNGRVPDVDLRALTETALSDSAEGARMRDALRAGAPADALAETIARLRS